LRALGARIAVAAIASCIVWRSAGRSTRRKLHAVQGFPAPAPQGR
jgi:hypothetical protein